jgi:hypothetical protein
MASLAVAAPTTLKSDERTVSQIQYLTSAPPILTAKHIVADGVVDKHKAVFEGDDFGLSVSQISDVLVPQRARLADPPLDRVRSLQSPDQPLKLWHDGKHAERWTPRPPSRKGKSKLSHYRSFCPEVVGKA